MQAIIKTGGKQYTVREGDVIAVERLSGKTASFTPLLVTDGDKNIGSAKASVTASVVAEAKGPKLIVFKMKPKKRYRVKAGHRQTVTQLKIEKISV